jgi:SNF2 family DNA or RNA helicase
VIDEAHYMKQIGGNWARAILRVGSHVQYRCALTGTPLPKSFTDAFNLFDFLWPYHNPINSKTKSLIYLKEKEHDGVAIKRILDDSIGPLFYRVRKSELGLLPQVFHSPKLIKMNKYERIVYDAIESKIKNYAKKDYLSNILLVTQLSRGRMIRLRQCISYTKLLLSSVENYREDMIGEDPYLRQLIVDYDKKEKPAKLEYLTDFVIKMQKKKQKLIIWANFIGTLELIGKHLTKSGLYCKLIYGKTPFNKESKENEVKEEETREKIRDEFVDEASGLNILIANPAACAESISLHKTCFNALYYDLSYNCAQYLQSLDRIHRVGGSENKKANYYFLQYENTLDQDIKANLDAKASKMSSVIDKDYAIYSLEMFEESEDIKAYERIFKKAHGRI